MMMMMMMYDMGRSLRETSNSSCGPSSIAVSCHALMLSLPSAYSCYFFRHDIKIFEEEH